MADNAREPSLGLTTWFYALAADHRVFSMTREQGASILARSDGSLSVDPGWRDSNGGLTMVGIGLVLQNHSPIYAERCCVSRHSLPGMAERTANVPVDFEALAGRLASDTASYTPNVEGLARFLAANSDRPLLDDLYILMQTGRSRLDDVWLDHLLVGAQTNYLWDLRRSVLHPPRTPIRTSKALARRHFARPRSEFAD